MRLESDAESIQTLALSFLVTQTVSLHRLRGTQRWLQPNSCVTTTHMAESAQAIPPFNDAMRAASRSALMPTPREWRRHAFLFLLTIITTTFAGVVGPGQEVDLAEPTTVLGWIVYVPHVYVATVAKLLTFTFHNPHVLIQGVIFSAALLTILLAHEMGHYIACLRYGVAATLPFFIPAPPLILAGTFGAFIKIKAPIPTRRALFDIGLAGAARWICGFDPNRGNWSPHDGTANYSSRQRDLL